MTRHHMVKERSFFAAAGIALAASSAPACADNEAMTRVFACENEDAKMEVYMPQSALERWPNLDRPVVGAYALDLTAALKGKHLETVRLSVTPDKKALVVDQFTRKLPPTRIPVDGGTVNFDNRFGSAAKCAALKSQ